MVFELLKLAYENLKQELIDREKMDTTLIMKSIGVQGRALKYKLVAQILEIENRGGELRELAPLITGDNYKIAMDKGDVDNALFMVGQSIGLFHDIPSCQELLDRMIKEAEDQLKCVMGKLH